MDECKQLQRSGGESLEGQTHIKWLHNDCYSSKEHYCSGSFEPKNLFFLKRFFRCPFCLRSFHYLPRRSGHLHRKFRRREMRTLGILEERNSRHCHSHFFLLSREVKCLKQFYTKLCYSTNNQPSISKSIPEHMHSLVYMVGHLLVWMLVGTIVLSLDIIFPALVTEPHLLHLLSFPSDISDTLSLSQVTSSYSNLLKDLEVLFFMGSLSVSIINPSSNGCNK